MQIGWWLDGGDSPWSVLLFLQSKGKYESVPVSQKVEDLKCRQLLTSEALEETNGCEIFFCILVISIP